MHKRLKHEARAERAPVTDCVAVTDGVERFVIINPSDRMCADMRARGLRLLPVAGVELERCRAIDPSWRRAFDCLVIEGGLA
jgi:hypothetical protein